MEVILNKSEPQKRIRGRPATKDVKNHKDTYFTDYYREHNCDYKCECGQSVKSMTLCKHIKSKKHLYLMEKVSKELI